jgi:hypothetical protein
MGNYSENESSIRVDFFKPGGKWQFTKAIQWTGGYKNCCIIDAFESSLRDAGVSLTKYNIVCLEPYHEHSHPLMIKATE